MNAQRPSAQRLPPLLVAIVGGSGSGKSWLAEKLEAALAPDAGRFSLDDFYRDRSHLPLGRRSKLNFDHPRAIDWIEVERVINELLAGRPAAIPAYDFETHCRLDRLAILECKPVILIDGLWLLRRRSLRRHFALSLFLDCPASVRLRRRLARDVPQRGRSRASVAAQFRKTVEPMHRRYVAPQARQADLVLSAKWQRTAIRPIVAWLRRARVDARARRAGWQSRVGRVRRRRSPISQLLAEAARRGGREHCNKSA